VPAAVAVLSPHGYPLPVDRRDPGGWVVQTPCGNRATLAVGTPLATPTVILDPGHGGDETGAVGPNRLRESVLNLAVSQYAKSALQGAGVSVILTRPGDDRVVLSTRSQLVRKLHPAAFVSVHHNSSPDGPRDSPGTETYYQYRSSSSKRLAGLIYEEVFRALSAYQVPWVGQVDAGAKYRLNDQGGDYYHMLRETAGVPSALAELAFLSNPPEADLLARPDVQRVEGEAVARGIMRFLRTQDPGSGYVTPIPRTSSAGGGGGEGCVDPPL
jgi:N-acetylmuramoyl-L-alanine amidase